MVEFVGWYGRGNVGDEAFKWAHQILFPEVAVNYSCEAMVPGGGSVVLGGGDVVLPAYLDCVPPGSPFYIYGAGLAHERDINLLMEKMPREAIFRNRSDVLLAERFNIPASYSPDLVFAITADMVGPGHLQRKTSKKQLGVLLSDAVSVSAWNTDIKSMHYYEYFQWELAQTLDYLSEFYEIHWIPFSSDPDCYDQKMNLSVRARMHRREDQHMAPTSMTPAEAMTYLGQMDMVFSMKLHGLIFSTVLGVPFVSLSDNRKCHLFMEELGVDGLQIPRSAFTSEKLLAALKVAESAGIAEMLRVKAGSYNEQVHATAARVRESWFAQVAE